MGEIAGCKFYIGANQFEYWRHTQLIIDVVPGTRRRLHARSARGRALPDPQPGLHRRRGRGARRAGGARPRRLTEKRPQAVDLANARRISAELTIVTVYAIQRTGTMSAELQLPDGLTDRKKPIRTCRDGDATGKQHRLARPDDLRAHRSRRRRRRKSGWICRPTRSGDFRLAEIRHAADADVRYDRPATLPLKILVRQHAERPDYPRLRRSRLDRETVRTERMRRNAGRRQDAGGDGGDRGRSREPDRLSSLTKSVGATP